MQIHTALADHTYMPTLKVIAGIIQHREALNDGTGEICAAGQICDPCEDKYPTSDVRQRLTDAVWRKLSNIVILMGRSQLVCTAEW